jgi:hypothetical protein
MKSPSLLGFFLSREVTLIILLLAFLLIGTTVAFFYLRLFAPFGVVPLLDLPGFSEK